MALNTANKFLYKVDDRVLFDLNGTEELKGTGTIVGFAMDTINPFYIVLLDTPILGQKAIICPERLMRRIKGW